MTEVILLLASVASADILRLVSRAGPAPERRLPAGIMGAGVGALIALGFGMPAVLWLLVATATILWTIWTSPDRSPTTRVATLTGLVAAVGGALAASSQLPSPSGAIAAWWTQLAIPSAHSITVEKFAITAAVLLLMLESSNVVVRIVLDAIGVDSSAREDHPFKGGRVIGAIERIAIVTLAVAGEYLAITAVVAAKSILRFPEVSTHKPEAEYVLLGSLVSWATAMGAVVLVALT
jgi:hypothetical protein